MAVKEGGGEGRTGSLGLADATTTCRMDKQVLLYSTGNYTRYPVIKHNGKEYEKEHCAYVELSHFAVLQKSIHYINHTSIKFLKNHVIFGLKIKLLVKK